MTENRRIVLNIVATYGRSLFALACGIFGGRWALMALGEVDCGLQGVVGGLTAFIGFFNGILAASVGRFYGLTIGKSRNSADEALAESQRWFSIALLVHTVVPAVLIAVGWPIGEWAVRNYLTIPADRLNACLWVFRFSCVGCLVGMTSVPFHAMYGAKQLIAELTIYGFAGSALNLLFLWYMVTHPAVWLAKYALWLTVLGIVPSLIISARAVIKFPECRFRLEYCFDARRIAQLFAYAFWQMFGSISQLLRTQGLAILVNRHFGPAINASMSIANNVNGKANELSNSMIGAFMPAITAAYGEGNMKKAHKLALRGCKFGVLASFVFSLPLALELPYVMRLWLVKPPEAVCIFIYALFIRMFINRTTNGIFTLIQATGRLAVYEIVVDGLALTMLPFAWALIKLGVGVSSIPYAIAIVTALYVWQRPRFAQKLAGLPVKEWMRSVLLPVVAIGICTLASGFGVRYLMSEGMLRLVVVVAVCELVLLPLSWIWLLDVEERAVIVQKAEGYFRKLMPHVERPVER